MIMKVRKQSVSNESVIIATSPNNAASFAVHVTRIPQWQSFLFSSIAPTIAAPFSNPLSVAKTQLQVQRGENSCKQFQGMTDFFRRAVASGGVATLQRGLAPSMIKESTKNVFRIGLYQPILERIHDESCPAPVWKRIVAGAASGAFGAVVCNPLEVMRIKLQGLELSSATNGVSSRLLKEEGVAGFYRATGASVSLGIVCTATNLTSYTKIREVALEHFDEGPALDMVCALASGFCAAVAMNPIDVIRTRLVTQPSSSPIYRNAYHAANQIMTNEGPKAFYKGFAPSFLRIGLHFAITFMLLEQMRRLAHSYREAKLRDEFLLRVFREIDDDMSGEIDQRELVAALTAANPFGSQHEFGVLAKKIFDVADEDKNGSIDQTEFLAAARKSQLDKLLRGQQLLVMFRNFDSNGDGEIDEKELFKALKRSFPEYLSHRVSDEELQQDVHRIINEIDTDGDKMINFSEFILAFDRVNELTEQRLVKDMFRSSGVAVGE